MAEVEIWLRTGHERVELSGPRVTLGKSSSNNLVLTGDPSVSRVHAVLEELAGVWCVSDVGSTNGTFVNGQRTMGRVRLQSGDEIRIGHARVVFRSAPGLSSDTVADYDRPALTPREHDVLRALCRPLLDRDLFTEPASIKEMAAELVVSEAAIKQHLTKLFQKFGVDPGHGHQRARLANEALRRGVLTLADLEGPTQ